MPDLRSGLKGPKHPWNKCPVRQKQKGKKNFKHYIETCEGTSQICVHCGEFFKRTSVDKWKFVAQKQKQVEASSTNTQGVRTANPSQTDVQSNDGIMSDQDWNIANDVDLRNEDSTFISTVRACGIPRLEHAPEKLLGLFGEGEFDKPRISPLSHWTEPVNKSTISLAVLDAMQAPKAKVFDNSLSIVSPWHAINSLSV